MRTGIVGNIFGYAEGPEESHGQGLDVDALAISREFPEQTIHFIRSDGVEMWFEHGRAISEPEWFGASE